MNFNATMIGQMITFMVFVWFCKSYVWPPIMNALKERKQQISDGLAAGERGKREHALAEKRAAEVLHDTKGQAAKIIARAEKRGAEIVDQAKDDARVEAERILLAARAETEQEVNRAKEVLRGEVVSIAVAGASKILDREIDESAHNDLMDKLVAQSKGVMMAENTSIARPYAQAAFEIAQQHDGLTQWSEMLALMAAVAQDSQLQSLHGSPRVTSEQFAQLFIDVCGDNIDDRGRNFLRLLAENDRLIVLPEIVANYETLRRDAEGKIQAQLITAFEATEQHRNAVAAALKARFGREVELECSTDSTLKGGAVIRAGDMVIDGSAIGRLTRLASTLSH